MFELPEYIILSRQINQNLTGKSVLTGNLGNSPHKFVWYNTTEAEFAEQVAGKRVGESFVRGRWLFIPLTPGFILLFGECGGKLLLHQPGSKKPSKYHIYVEFTDGSFLTLMTQTWGAMELYPELSVWKRQYIHDMRPSPLDQEFTLDHFFKIIQEATRAKKTSAKALLTQDQIIPGLGNSIAQDILFNARLHPKQNLALLDKERIEMFYHAIHKTIEEIIEGGGRYDEVDLFGNPGGYKRLMDKNQVGHPCPCCDSRVEKLSYLGGSCYLCPSCQTLM